MLDVRRLRLLRELAARGTIAATAEALSYSAPAVSQQLAVLEREAGVALLERRGRSVALTDAGRLLVARTELVLAELEATEAALAQLADAVVGPLRMSAFPSVAATIVPPALAALLADHPGLEPALLELEPEDGLAALGRREVDLAVSHEYAFDMRPRMDGIERTHLLDDPLALALPEGHPALAGGTAVGLGDVDLPWVGGRPGTACGRIIVHAGRAVGIEPRIAYRSNEFEVHEQLVAHGLCAALIPRLGRRDTPGVAYVEVAGLALTREVYVAVRSGSRGRPAVAAAIAALKSAALSSAA